MGAGSTASMTTGARAGMTAKDVDHDLGKGVASWKPGPKELPARASVGDNLWHSSNRMRIIVMAGNRTIV